METKEKDAGRQRRYRRHGRTSAVLAAALLAATAAYGQKKNENPTGILFNFSTPGARSLGMGGAFIGLADDATAAYTNPAGLSNLAVGGPEVAIEGRSWRFYNRYVSGGNLSGGKPTGFGLDTVEGPSLGTSAIDTRGISFLSVGYVLPHGWTVALYRHEPIHFSNRFVAQGAFRLSKDSPIRTCDIVADSFDKESPGLCRDAPSRRDLSVQVENLGLSVAHEFLGLFPRRADSLSVGLGVSRYRFRGQIREDDFAYQPTSGNLLLDRLPGGLFGPTDLLEDQRLLTFSTDDDKSKLSLNAGVLWKIGDKGRWSLGAVYRQGASFTVHGTAVAGPALKRRFPQQELPPIPTPPTSFRLPDSWGLGAAYGADGGNTKITLDFDQIRYSQRRIELDPSIRSAFRIADSNEIHVGYEHIVPISESLFVATLRLGASYEPYHELVERGLPAGSGTYHWAGGLGLVIKEDYQIDVAVDVSHLVNTVSLSLVKFF